MDGQDITQGRGLIQQEFWTQERLGALEARLDPKLTAQRDAFDGGRRKLTYLEGHAAIAQLNRLFGYGGWSYTLDQQGTDEYTEGPEEGWYLQCWAVVTLRVGGVSRQDVGTTEVQNSKRTDKTTGAQTVRNNVRNVDSRSTARKGAVTDALKRAARTFGQQLGNGLYDQDDNVYAWMVAHGLEEDQVGGERAQARDVPPVARPSAPARTPARTGEDATPAHGTGARGGTAAPSDGASREAGADVAADERYGLPRSAADWTRPQLRARIRHDSGMDLRAGQDWAELARLFEQPEPRSAADMTHDWLLALHQEMTARGYVAEIEAATSEREVTTAVQRALGDRDKRHVSAAQYDALRAAGEARKAELSAPLLSAVPATVAS